MRVPIGRILISYVLPITLEKITLGCTQCPFINNAIARVNSQFRGTQSYNITVKGCLEPERFLGGRVESIEISCINEEITHLGERSIGNMTLLKYIRITKCPVQFVEPHAFQNIPEIVRIVLNDSKLKELGKDVFIDVSSLQSLDVQNNEIDFIEDLTFDGLHNLQYLYLSHNKLTFWSRGWFQNNTSLYLVELTHNLLQRIPRRAFRHLPKLKNLNLSYNRISLIDERAFDDVINMTILNLGHNHLTTLPLNMFGRIIGRRMTLNLELNLLNYLPELLVQRMAYSIGSLFIRGNPLKCPCLDLIHKVIYDFNMIQTTVYKHIFVANSAECGGADIPQCGFAKYLPINCTETVDSELTQRMFNYLQKLNPTVADVCYNADRI